MFAALQSTAAAAPTVAPASRVAAGSPNVSLGLTISNVGAAATVFPAAAVPFPWRDGPSCEREYPQPAARRIRAGRRQSQRFFAPSGAVSGLYPGGGYFSPGSPRMSLYWYAVPSGIPARITVLNAPSSGSSVGQNGILFRVTDVGRNRRHEHPAGCVRRFRQRLSGKRDFETTPKSLARSGFRFLRRAFEPPLRLRAIRSADLGGNFDRRSDGSIGGEKDRSIEKEGDILQR